MRTYSACTNILFAFDVVVDNLEKASALAGNDVHHDIKALFIKACFG